jgi:hypothetical protein
MSNSRNILLYAPEIARFAGSLLIDLMQGRTRVGTYYYLTVLSFSIY